MYQSLCVTLASLPKPTRVYCGHEVIIFFEKYYQLIVMSVPIITEKTEYVVHGFNLMNDS